MAKQDCSHTWEMVDVTSGLIVMKKCFHCGDISTCFVSHRAPPLEACREGDHFWNFVESDDSFRFNLKCTQCGTLVKFDELVGLMLCTGCDETCDVDILRRKLEAEGTGVCIALGRRPIEKRKQLTPEKFAILEVFFKQQSDSFNSVIVSHEMVKNIAKCYATIIKDAADLL